MTEIELSKVEDGLSILIKKYKQNHNKDDSFKLKATMQAKSAIRSVMLNVALHGDIKKIIPINIPQKGFGWKISLSNGMKRDVFGLA